MLIIDVDFGSRVELDCVTLTAVSNILAALFPYMTGAEYQKHDGLQSNTIIHCDLNDKFPSDSVNKQVYLIKWPGSPVEK